VETVVTRKLYEGMFLVDSAQASDWDATITILESVLKRADAEIVSIRKWDERRLAYEINGKSRGAYILCYFRADGEKIQDIEKAVQLSEQIMRVLILSTEQMTPEDIEKDTPAMKAEKEKEEAAGNASGGDSEPESPDEPTAETGEAESAGVAEQAGEAEESTEPQELEPSTEAGASAEAESEQTKEQAQE